MIITQPLSLQNRDLISNKNSKWNFKIKLLDKIVKNFKYKYKLVIISKKYKKIKINRKISINISKFNKNL